MAPWPKMFLVLIFLSLTGCSILEYKEQLLTLKALFDEQAGMQEQVSAQDKVFEELVHAVKTEQIKQYPTQVEILAVFGEPILKKNPTTKSPQESWMYRYPMKFFNSDKVFLYFDQDKKLVEWKFISGQ